MYFEEKLIDGRLHWRNDPNGEWKAYTIEELSKMLVDANHARSVYTDRTNRAIAVLQGN